MKASIRFRDDNRPLVRAKVPLNILGFPFSSAISAGDATELQLDLATAFSAGPALRLSYRPNDPSDPFRVSIRTGAGTLGSPAGGAPLSMSAEFSVLARGGAPRFMLTVKPRMGDFGIRRLVASEDVGMPQKHHNAQGVPMQQLVIGRRIGEADGPDSGGGGEGSNGGEEQHQTAGGGGWKANGYVTAAKSAVTYPARAVDRLLSGTELTARTLLPLRSRALVKVRWGVRVPSELRCAAFADEDVFGGGVKQRLGVPFLVMSKLSIEHISEEQQHINQMKPKELVIGNDLAEACFSVRRQLESLREENGMLRKAVDALHMDFAGGRKESNSSLPVGRGNGKGSSGGSGRDEELRSGRKQAPTPATPQSTGTNAPRNARGRVGNSKEPIAATTKDEVNEELRKALMDATGSTA